MLIQLISHPGLSTLPTVNFQQMPTRPANIAVSFLILIAIVFLIVWWSRSQAFEEDVQQTGYDPRETHGSSEPPRAAATEHEFVPPEAKHAITAEETSPEAQAAESAAPSEPDDLKRIEGIGPKIESVLKAAGIHTFAQLANTPVGTLEEIVREDAGIRIAFPDTWPEQAHLAAEGKWDAFEKLTEELKGGRRVEDK